MPSGVEPLPGTIANRSPVPSIFIVEDDGLIALRLQEYLTKSGFDTPDPVASGEDAIECLKKSPSPDLILMDVALGGKIDGIETAREIRKVSPIPVIFLTAHNDAKTLARAQDVGSSGFIVKPFVENEVISLVRGTLCG